jgi:ectoine hydroxylase-related dioxygenase (phytanoyl-CoA dioxygenase family)
MRREAAAGPPPSRGPEVEMNNLWAFLPMRESNDLLDDPDALRARLDEDSYLLLRGVLPRDQVLALRDDIIDIMVRCGWVLGGKYTADALSIVSPLSEADDDFHVVYQEVQRLERFHTLAHAPELAALMTKVVGPTAFPHPLKIARLAFPTNHEVSTPPHQDFPNNQGTAELTASWIPVGDVPASMAGLAVLRGSHRHGVLPLVHHPGPGNRQAVLDTELLESCHWVTTDFEAGDVLLFPSTTVHASLNNETDSMRISVDYRFQREGQPLTPIVLEPHFQRLSWEEVYRDWSSTDLQYYWRDLDYEVVPFETFPLAEPPPPVMPDDEMWGHLLRQKRRHDQRLERLAAMGVMEEGP